jgi:ApaG protein
MGQAFTYEKETNGVTIRVTPRFLDDESSPRESRYVWAYAIEIQNHNDHPVQLLTRHWRILDRNGGVQEVDGEGVVGQTPVIEPGESFEYSSGAPLPAPSGVMQGHYTFSNGCGEDMSVPIPTFSLDSPYESSQPN